MSTTKVVDYGSAQTLHCQVMVDGDWADFDPTASDASIKSAIEALGSMSGHTVTVTNLISQRKWQFAFDFTVTTFAATLDDLVMRLKCDEGSGTTASDSSGQGNNGTLSTAGWTSSTENGGGSPGDLTFSNPYAFDGSSGDDISVSNPVNLPNNDQGETLFIRFKFPSSPPSFCILASHGTGGGDMIYIAYYASYSGILLAYGTTGVGYNAYFTWTPDTDWHTLAFRMLPSPNDLQDAVPYFDGTLQTFSFDGNSAPTLGGNLIVAGDYINYAYPANAIIDQFLIFRGDKGDTFAQDLNDYNPSFTVTITDGTIATGNASQMIRRLRKARAR